MTPDLRFRYVKLLSQKCHDVTKHKYVRVKGVKNILQFEVNCFCKFCGRLSLTNVIRVHSNLLRYFIRLAKPVDQHVEMDRVRCAAMTCVRSTRVKFHSFIFVRIIVKITLLDLQLTCKSYSREHLYNFKQTLVTMDALIKYSCVSPVT